MCFTKSRQSSFTSLTGSESNVEVVNTSEACIPFDPSGLVELVVVKSQQGGNERDNVKGCTCSHDVVTSNESVPNETVLRPSQTKSLPPDVDGGEINISQTLVGDSSVSRVIKRRRKKRTQKPGVTAKNRPRHFVKHNYHDHIHDKESDHDPYGEVEKRKKGGVITSFPFKLHLVLNKMNEDGLTDVLSWQPHGRAFRVHDIKRFVEEVMGQYFGHKKLTSFQRQLNLYGFERITHGQDEGSYYHELFLFGKEFLCRSMVRKRIKGTRYKASSHPESEPDLYSYPFVNMNTTAKAKDISSNIISKNVESSMFGKVPHHSQEIKEAVTASPNQYGRSSYGRGGDFHHLENHIYRRYTSNVNHYSQHAASTHPELFSYREVQAMSSPHALNSSHQTLPMRVLEVSNHQKPSYPFVEATSNSYSMSQPSLQVSRSSACNNYTHFIGNRLQATHQCNAGFMSKYVEQRDKFGPKSEKHEIGCSGASRDQAGSDTLSEEMQLFAQMYGDDVCARGKHGYLTS